MKSITESIIGRRGVPKELHKFNDLRYGGFVTIEIPTNHNYAGVFLYVPDNIAKLVCDLRHGPYGFGRFISAKKYIDEYVVPEINAANFKDNFPECPEDKVNLYSKITNYNGHAEEYKFIKKKEDVVDIFRKYRFL